MRRLNALKIDFELFEDNFEFRMIDSHTWCFSTKSEATPDGCNCYLLEGTQYAIMIDAGMSRLNLKRYIDILRLTDKPLLGVINTNMTAAHARADHFWGKVYASEAQASAHPEWECDVELVTVADGAVIDLGNRPLRLYALGKNWAILDESARWLYTGDLAGAGWVTICKEDGVEMHRQWLKQLKALDAKYDFICPAHNGTPLDKNTINLVLRCDEKLLDQICTKPDQECYQVRYQAARVQY